MNIFKFNKNHLISFVISLIIFVFISILFSQTNLFEGLEWGAEDFRFYLRDTSQADITLEKGISLKRVNKRARDDIVVLGIDEETIREFSEMKLDRKCNNCIYKEDINWPFPWDVHAKFLDVIASGNPIAILWDIMFLEHKKYENLLVKAVKNSKVSFLDYPFETKFIDKSYADKNERIKHLAKVRWKAPPILIPDEIISRWRVGDKSENRFLGIDEILKTFKIAAKEDKLKKIYSDFLNDLKNIYLPNPDMDFLNLTIKLKKDILDNSTFQKSENIQPGKIDPLLEYLYKFTDNIILDIIKQFYIVKEVSPPTPALLNAAKGAGFANVFPGRDKITRNMPLVIEFRGWYYPNIDLSIVMQYYGITQKDVEIKMGEYIKLKNLDPKKMKIPNKNNEIIIPINVIGCMDINYIGGPGSYDSKSYSWYYRDKLLSKNEGAFFKDKIILVAAYSVTGIATDEKKSPYGTMFGIEHHANALNTILNQSFLHKLTDNQNIIIMLVIAILLGIVISQATINISLIFTGALALIISIVSIILFEQINVVTAYVAPIIQIALTFMVVVTYRILTEQKEKKFIRQTFSKFVSKTVVDDLLKHPDNLKLGGDKMDLTVLFSDIRGFTTISEQLEPEQLVIHLNEYLQKMTDLVFKYDGTLDKYVGDEIMAFWGAPVFSETHVIDSCKSALEMMEELHKLNAQWKLDGKPEMDIGIGLNTGPMVVGNMGSSSRMDYTLMGDNVNLAARLEGTNKVYKTNIIISEYTYERVKDQVIVRELDLIRVKGKMKPVRIYELLDIKE